jgi:hypothetical protein
MPGLVSLFTTANPLFLQFANDLDKGAAKFQQWAASSTGAKTFVAYAQAQLPKVEQLIETLATTVGHLAQGFAPLGGTTLTTLTLFAQVINRIPIGVLQQLAPLLVGLKVASTAAAAMNNLSLVLGPLAVKLGLVAAAEEGAVISTGTLAAAFGPLAAATVAVVGGVELLKTTFPSLNSILSVHTLPAVDANTQGINALTNAYRDAHNGIDGTSKQLLEWGSNATNAKTAAVDYAGGTKQVNQALAELRTQYGGVATNADSATASTIGLTAAQQKLVGQVMSSNTQLGFLSATLDKFSNNAISAQQMELQFKDALAGASAQVKQNGSALNDNTVKGRSNQEWLLNQITAVNQHAVAVGKQTGSVKQATTALGADETQLIAAANAAGFNKQQVQALIHQYALTPKQVETAVKADTANALAGIAGVQAALNNLQSYKVLQIVEVTSKIAAGSAGTNLATRDSGGPVTAGTPYLIGLNRRPEIFVPEQSGMVAPIPRGVSGSPLGAATINVTVQAGALVHQSDVGRYLVGVLEQAFAGGQTVTGGQAAMR